VTATIQSERPGTDEPGKRRRPPLSFTQKLTRGALLTAILLIIAMWVYAFGFASKKAAAQLDDNSWSKRAEQICDQRNDLLAKNARETRDANDDSPRAIGRGVEAGTDLIEAALDEIVAVQPASQSDIDKVAEFERLYRIYIADRRAAEAKLASGEAAELNETTLYGSPISDTIRDFTNPNRMPNCAPPATF
jgi:hypothetical protein